MGKSIGIAGLMNRTKHKKIVPVLRGTGFNGDPKVFIKHVCDNMSAPGDGCFIIPAYLVQPFGIPATVAVRAHIQNGELTNISRLTL